MVSQRAQLILLIVFYCFSAPPLGAQEKKEGPKDLSFYREFLHQAEMVLLQRNGAKNARKALDLCPEELRQFEWHYLNAKCTGTSRELKGHERSVRQVTFSPDNTTLASASNDKTVKLWDITTGKCKFTLAHEDLVLCVGLDDRGALSAAGGRDGGLTLWDTQTGKNLGGFAIFEDAVRGVAFCPNSRLLGAFTYDEVRVLDHAKRKVMTSLKLENVGAIGFSADGKLMAIGQRDQLSLWKVPEFEPVEKIPLLSSITDIAFHPDGKRLFTASPAGIRSWDLRTWEATRLRISDEGASSIALSKNGNVMLTLDGKGKARVLYEPFEKASQVHLLTENSLLALNPSGTMISIAGYEPEITLMDINEPLAMVRAPEPIWSVQPVKDQFLVTMRKGTALFSLTEDGFKLKDEVAGHRGSVRAVAYQPGGRLFATAGADRVIKIQDQRDNKELVNLTGHKALIRALAFSPDGKRLASASDDQTIKIWDPLLELELRTLRGHKGMVTCAVFLPKADLLVSSGGDGTIKLWNLKTGENLQTWPAHEDGVSHLILAPDGKRLASAGGDKKIKIWDTASRKMVHTLPSPTSMVQSLAFSPDGKRLASGGLGDGVTLWDPERGERVYTFSRVTGPINAIAFSPDGRTLFSGSYDGTIVLWKAPRTD